MKNRRIRNLTCALMIGLSSINSLPVYSEPKPVMYNFGEFFSEKFQPQKTIEDLISYTYCKYNSLLKKAKVSYPEQTLENLLDNAHPFDLFKFWWLANIDYATNLDKLNYNLEKISVNDDYIRIIIRNKKIAETLNVTVNVNALPDSINPSELKSFLESNENHTVKTNGHGEKVYEIVKLKR